MTKTAPYYKCVQKEKECPPGYKADVNNKCQDINECKKNSNACVGGARCQNTKGSYKCICEIGFEYVKGQGCKDTDECKNNDPWATCGYGDCINTIGSYACKCKPGYVYKGMALAWIFGFYGYTENCQSSLSKWKRKIGMCQR